MLFFSPHPPSVSPLFACPVTIMAHRALESLGALALRTSRWYEEQTVNVFTSDTDTSIALLFSLLS